MTDLEALIDRLADSGAQRDPRHAVRFFALLLGAVVLGGAATALVLEDAFASVTLYGVGPIAVKWGFSFTLLLLAGAALFVLGQPGKPGKAAMIALAVPMIHALTPTRKATPAPPTIAPVASLSTIPCVY